MCYYNSAKYRDEVAKEKVGHFEDEEFLLKLRDYIKSGKISIMDKETMGAFEASSVLRYDKGIVIANER
jgi:hypothetical protein